MDAPPAARLEFEMLDRVCDVNRPPVYPGFFQCLIQQLAGRTNKRPANNVFLIARLFADEHHPRVMRAFAKHGLRRGREQRTTLTGPGVSGEGTRRAGRAHGEHRRAVKRLVHRTWKFVAFLGLGQPTALRGRRDDGFIVRVPPGRERFVINRLF